MMISMLALSSLLSFNAHADEVSILDCVTTKIYDDNIFEESLSIEEYPSVDVEQLEKRGKKYFVISYGANEQIDPAEGDKVTNLSTNRRSVFSGQYRKQKYKVIVEVNKEYTAKNKRWGVLKYQAGPKAEKIDVAQLMCD